MGAIEALANALKAFTGGVLVISHDQHFITQVIRALITPPINTPYQHTLLTHHINTPFNLKATSDTLYHFNEVTHPVNLPSAFEHTLSTCPLLTNTPSEYTHRCAMKYG